MIKKYLLLHNNKELVAYIKDNYPLYYGKRINFVRNVIILFSLECTDNNLIQYIKYNKRKIAKYKEEGYKTLVIWEKDIKNKRFTELIDKFCSEELS